MIEIPWRENPPTSALHMAEIKFDSYQSWQLLHDTISDENGTQGRDLLSLCFWQSHFPEYYKHLRIYSWTELELETPNAWKPFNCCSSISGSAWRPSQGGKFPYAPEEWIANNSGRKAIIKDKNWLRMPELKRSVCQVNPYIKL